MKTATLYEQFVLPTYPAPSLILQSGKGTRVWDEEGTAYLDLTSGIGVTALGHSHPQWVRLIRRQAAALAHVSNLFGNRNQALLARKIADYAGPGKTFFANSGAEANEGLIKLARLYGREKAGGHENRVFEVVCASNAFHGRTMGGLSATPKPKIQSGFAPFLDGFRFAQWNDLDSFRSAVSDKTAAIMVETIQGEGGVHPADTEFLQGLKQLCAEKKILFILDEVQCGIGRTGQFFACQHAGVRPDALGMAKGLGCGFPIGAFWVSEKYARLFTPGSHGSTFGGNPLACAAALATLEVIEDKDLIAKVDRQGKLLLKKLKKLQRKHPGLILEIRGRGFMLGVELSIPAATVLDASRKRGLLVLSAGENVLRLLPPLTIKPGELNQALDILGQVFAEVSES